MSDLLLADLDRRTVLQGAAALGVPVALSRRRRRRRRLYQQEGDGSGLPRIASEQAEHLAAAVGVVIHLHFGGTVYAHTGRVVDAVSDLGVRHVRNRITRTTGGRQGFTELARRGVRINGVCGAAGDPQTMFEVFSEIMRTYPDPTAVFSSFEGINEPNLMGRPWVEETRLKTRGLWLQRQAQGLQEIPIVAPALARLEYGGVEGADTQAQSANLGSLAQYVDYGNIHVYPRGMNPGTDIDEFMGYQRAVVGNKPMYCTEGGYFTGMNYVGGSNPTPADTAAKYTPRQIMEHWSRGNQRFFNYELLDDHDPSGADRESNFGLLAVEGNGPDDRWTPKPAYTAIKNFVAILGDPGGSHAPRGLRLQVSGVPDVKTALVAKRDRSRYLVMWRDVLSYDPRARQAVETSTRTASVAIGRPRDVQVFLPNRSASPVQRLGTVDRFEVPVGDELVICRIL